MVEIGRMNRLKAVKMVDFGMYLDGGEGVEILLPTRYVPVGGKVGDELDVFIYQDNQGRLIATTDTPLAQVGEFRFLKVKAVNQVGAFLEWGNERFIGSIQRAKGTDAGRKVLFGVRAFGSCFQTDCRFSSD